MYTFRNGELQSEKLYFASDELWHVTIRRAPIFIVKNLTILSNNKLYARAKSLPLNSVAKV